jgi:hypothetical protein
MKAGEIMNIDISKLSEAELIDLDNRIVERLRFLKQMRSHKQMIQFSIGERVTFQPEGQPPVVGMKTVTVITDDGQHWNVSPRFLRKAVSESVTNTKNNGSEEKGTMPI